MKDRNSMDTDDYYNAYLGPVPQNDEEADEMAGLCDRDFIEEDIESEGNVNA